MPVFVSSPADAENPARPQGDRLWKTHVSYKAWARPNGCRATPTYSTRHGSVTVETSEGTARDIGSDPTDMWDDVVLKLAPKTELALVQIDIKVTCPGGEFGTSVAVTSIV